MSYCARLSLGIVTVLFGVLPMRAETLPTGTEMVIELESAVQPAKNGEPFSATLAFPVFAGGREVVPMGTRIDGEIRGTKKEVFLSPRHLLLPDGRQVDFTATVSKIDNQHLEAEQKEGTIEERGSGGAAAQQAGEIAITGAQVGAMTTGTAAGAGMGAAVGVAAVLIGRQIAGHHHSMVIPAGTQLTLNLTQSLEIPEDAAAASSRPSEDHAAGQGDRRPVLRRSETEPPENLL